MKAANDNTPRLIAMKDASAMTSMSRTLILALMREGRFPQSVQLGERRYAFVRAEVVAWIDAKISGRASA
ncbi:helix-turn-helix transcriptional regulator [Aurantimonas endophytica]|uniref:Prophage regulatory protein n=1 Tax=Aurantimonas endophytica TaxID=1522175 RepID=A0A7W6HCK0_9HYPH|nr:AlpA family phage regulatory protein [Aurantimonas endophytica]MBB4002632.1 prophage regulatory protein [Aurantimonas endophytica]MCO6403513.1 AlpA family phage regulatory protein [Aurantimonas endophytica]